MAEKRKGWIKSAIKHPGAFKAKAQAAGESTSAFAKSHDKGDSTTAKQARLAETLMGMNRSKKLYDHPSSSKK